MLYGRPEFFDTSHYERCRGRAPAYLCELVCHCLELVSQLAASGLEFRFKGGNSLLLLLGQPQRFSIDVDIVTTTDREILTTTVKEIIANCDLFNRFEVRHPKTKPWLPLASYKLFFESAYRAPEEAYVMLDAVFEAAPYDGITRPVRCGNIYHSDQTVEVPSISGLLGDKLLTLGPSTLGIPFGKGKEAHRLKHVFDVSRLLDEEWDLGKVNQAVRGCMEQENRIQRSHWDWPTTRGDTLEFLRAPLPFDAPPDAGKLDPKGYLYETAIGFQEFRQVLFALDFTWPDFLEACRKVISLTEKITA